MEIKDLIRHGLRLEKDRKVDVVEHTDNAPYKLDRIRLFRSCYQFNKDPMPLQYWVLVDDSKLFRGDRMIDALKEIQFVPASSEEAAKIGELIAYAADSRNELLNVDISEKGGYYEILIEFNDLLKKIGIPDKYTVKIGKGIYELE